MEKFLKKYRHLAALLAVLVMAFALVQLGLPFGGALFVVGLWQLSQFAMSKRCGVCFNSVLTPEQVQEFEGILRDLKLKYNDVADMTKRFPELQKQVNGLRRQQLAGASGEGVRWIGGIPFVSDNCAEALTSVFVLECAGIKALENLVKDSAARERVLGKARGILGIQQRAGLSPTEIPLPTVYVPQIIELVFAYGQARKFATVFPLGAGAVKLPRLQAGEDDFGFIGIGTASMSQPIPERKVTAELVTFTANKFGGLIRIPTELEEDTFIPLGQFLARYIARQMAKGEDKTLFLGDGTASYANILGVGPYCVANAAYLRQLAGTKTHASDATISDFRAMRAMINPACFFGMTASGMGEAAYYMNPTMEALLVTFNTIGQPLIYRPQNGAQPATLDGFPIHWIGVTRPFSTAPTPSGFLAFFGNLSYWYLGEREQVRVEVSREVFFATDELAMRAIERIDVEAMAIDAMSALQCAAA